MLDSTIRDAKHYERRPTPLVSPDIERVAAALQGLRYGAVTVIVQDGVIVQVDRTEKIRVERDRGSRSS
jgi:hypothetical protein